jgi:hypothetical protein
MFTRSLTLQVLRYSIDGNVQAHTNLHRILKTNSLRLAQLKTGREFVLHFTFHLGAAARQT